MHIGTVSTQWASRPVSQRYVSLNDMAQVAHTDRDQSTGKVVSTRRLHFEAIPDTDHKGMQIVGQNGIPAAVTHYSFGQLAALAKAPAGFLRQLPAELSADNLNYGMRHLRDAEDVGVLLTRKLADDGEKYVELRAATGPNYGRIWNSDLIDAVRKYFGDGTRETGGRFQVPGEFRKQVPITNKNTTFYYGDRSVMIYLADEQNDIEIPNRRHGQYGQLARGVIFWNSEVGDETCGMSSFLYDYTCMNRNIWGVEEYKEIRIRHTASAPDKWIEQVAPVAQAIANSPASGIVEVVKAAQAAKIEEDLDLFLKNRQFTRPQVSAIKNIHMIEEERPIETLWDASVAVSAYARSVKWDDERMDMERRGGAFLSMAQKLAA